ncbi:hypothetical protein ACWOA0_03840 [Ignavigranum ruoffiae]|uniref:Uncharacterized protein n=1 Tax=Ignavigranum ruoffiae TaxID=89093 RepID=A0A1H9F7Q6_9LACT|nr:hypothetical protein [Ignavigranum ruoffiae]SEQ33899.1 hypothetical protein SAMN04488558_10899 [Ignavigranum ruoffiae]
MAKRKKGNKPSTAEQEFEQVDIFYLPKAVASMYRVLRQAVKEEIMDWAQAKFSSVTTVSDPDEGEAVIALNADQEEVFRYYLNPNNISQAQQARDKDRLDDYLSQLFED